MTLWELYTQADRLMRQGANPDAEVEVFLIDDQDSRILGPIEHFERWDKDGQPRVFLTFREHSGLPVGRRSGEEK